MAQRRGILRVLDANANRALEGLRVCEDIARFCLEAPASVRRLRALRHGLSAQLRRLPVSGAALVQSRDARRDIGRRFRASRARSVEHLLLMNLQRAKEALRVLEESARLVAPHRASRFQRLRFGLYDAERYLLIGLATLRHHRPLRRARS